MSALTPSVGASTGLTPDVIAPTRGGHPSGGGGSGNTTFTLNPGILSILSAGPASGVSSSIDPGILSVSGAGVASAVNAAIAAGVLSISSPGMVNPLPSGPRNPFNSSSPWNQTLATKFPSGVPALPTISNDDAWLGKDGVAGVLNGAPNVALNAYSFWGNLTSATTIAWYVITPAMVSASPHTQGVAFSSTKCLSSKSATTTTGGGGTYNIDMGFQIPAGALPSPGSDAQFTFWDRDHLIDGGWWDFWQVVGSPWTPDGSNRVQCTNFSHFTDYDYTCDGVPFNGGTSGTQYASRGPGISYIGGLIRFDEWNSGAGPINHMIACATNNPSAQVIYPACKSDGSQTSGTVMGEGGVFALRPDFPIADLPTQAERTVATAMRDYGLIMSDTSGNPKVYFESDVSQGGGAQWGGVIPQDMLLHIPIVDFYCVDPAGTSTNRYTNLRRDYTASSADPLGTLPAIQGSVALGGSATPGSVNATATPAALATNELVLCFVYIKGSNGQQTTAISGTNGLNVTWKPTRRQHENRAVGQNLSIECFHARASSNTAGTVTVTCATASTVGLILVRLTALSTIGKLFALSCASSSDTTMTVPLRALTTNSLVLNVVATRNVTTAAGTGQTGVSLNNTTGAGGSIVKANLLSAPSPNSGNNDFVSSPTQGGGEWVGMALEIT